MSLLVVTSVLYPVPGQAASNGHFYAGIYTSGFHLGVDGYLRQSGTVHIDTGAHVNFINVCGQLDCSEWVQAGTYQGYGPTNGHSPDQVHMFHENMDQCLRHTLIDDGPPPQADYPYYLSYDGSGVHFQSCPDGSQSSFYVYEYRRGSFTSVPYFYGQVGDRDGQIVAETEIFPQTVPINTDYYGCDSSRHCTSQSYGLHLYDSSWSTWTTDALVQAPDDPPAFRLINDYWSFQSCPGTSC